MTRSQIATISRNKPDPERSIHCCTDFRKHARMSGQLMLRTPVSHDGLGLYARTFSDNFPGIIFIAASEPPATPPLEADIDDLTLGLDIRSGNYLYSS